MKEKKKKKKKYISAILNAGGLVPYVKGFRKAKAKSVPNILMRSGTRSKAFHHNSAKKVLTF